MISLEHPTRGVHPPRPFGVHPSLSIFDPGGPRSGRGSSDRDPPGSPETFAKATRSLLRNPKATDGQVRYFLSLVDLAWEQRTPDGLVLTDGEIGEALGLTRESVQRLNRQLERAELVRREPAPKDRKHGPAGRRIVFLDDPQQSASSASRWTESSASRWTESSASRWSNVKERTPEEGSRDQRCNVGVSPGSGPEKTPSPGGAPVPPRRPVKKVDERTRHRALALTGKLVAPGAGEDDVMAFVGCLADLFGDANPALSREKYEQTAWNLVHGKLPLNLVMESIEATCDKDPRKLRSTRGSYFMGVLKKKLSASGTSGMARPAKAQRPAPTPLLDAVKARETALEPAEAPEAPEVAEGPDPRSVAARLAGDLAAGPKVPRPSDPDAGDALPPNEAAARLRAMIRGNSGSGGPPPPRPSPPPTRRTIDRAELEKLAASDPILARELASRPRPGS